MNQQPTESRVYRAEVRDLDAAQRTMVGLAAPYDTPIPVRSDYIEILSPGCFKKSIKEAARGLPLHAFHDTDTWPVGVSTRWEETSDGLVGHWRFADTEQGEHAWKAAQSGIVSGLSVGFQPIVNEIADCGSDTAPPVVIRKEARLFEVSIVSAPAYPSAQIMMVRTAGLGGPARPHLEAWRRWQTKTLGGDPA